ncbi:L-idonate 5-dehydrogenase [Pararhizobium sp. IMCC21322]|uniref:L-idonate 5-dehydrogenase n=1 Tax=Pararhizobium sp. IMCC21322 TaxID=3067903 RepID=UPI00274072ED|nr:L-idonate 5-dehydrogenase [Pararhizobium sp. IMCC21322]
MRAIVIHKAKDLRVEERAEASPKAGQVAITLATGGICGSDLHYYNHGGFGPITIKEPMILGHEVSGYIRALGDGVEGLEIGDLVAISPSRPCGSCKYCAEGKRNHCLNMRFYGSAMPFPHIQGAFQESLIADASQCVKANGLTAGEAAVSEPLSVTLHAVRRVGEMLGKKVLITGSGPIGTLCILAARAAGAAEIVVTDLSDQPLAYATKVGADRTINVVTAPDALEAYQPDKGYFDVLFECSGAAPALAAGMAVMRPRGVVMQLGMSGNMTLPMLLLTAKELDLRGSFRFHEEFPTAVQLMQSGQIDVKPLISHTFGIDDAVEAFDVATDRGQSMKTQIQFSASA